MVTQTMPSDRDVRTLAAIVSQERPDRSEAGLPFSLLSDLAGQIPCDYVLFEGYDIKRQEYWFAQQVPDDEEDPDSASDQGMHQALWEHFWDCKFCSYPDRTGDLRSVFQVTDFYSVREWHSTGMYSDSARPQGLEHLIEVCLPEPPGSEAGPGRIARLFLVRGPGPEFSERDRALLTLLRPHLHQAYLDAERRRSPVPDLTPRQWELLHLIAAGRTNIQVARQLGLSEGTVRTHLENIYARLDVSNRTAAVMRAFPEKNAHILRPEAIILGSLASA
jgi:DNA-binding CsgD family transcriptional regulator